MEHEEARPARKTQMRMAAFILICVLTPFVCIQTTGDPEADAGSETATEDIVWQPSKGELTRLDKDGYLYYLDYTKDYYSDEVLQVLANGGEAEPGCSAFFTYSLEGDPLSCRNYDYLHRVSDEDRTLTGLNVVVHCAPPDKYESIAVADATFCGKDDPLLTRGGPDMEGFSADMVDAIPYLCMDGMNEKGLCVSVLKVDIMKGDESARTAAGAPIMLRLLIDNCADVDEAIAYVSASELTPADWQNCHFFVTDAAGNSVVIESRNGKLSTIWTDVVTNFYVGSDDIADSNRGGKLREEAVRLVDEYGEPRYLAGYGHGYHRFAVLASQLEMHRDTKADEYRTRMTEPEALVMLQSVAQNRQTVATGSSCTQFSCMYRNAAGTVSVWSFQNWETAYTFDTSGERLP